MRFLVAFFSLAITIVSALHSSSEGLVNEARIYRGHNAESGQFPYTVGLEIEHDDGSDWCGGSLIGSNWVLTSAHCFNECLLSQLFIIYLGMTLREDAELAYTLGVDKVYFHPNWDARIDSDDIALIEIPATEFCDCISPIPLPKISSTDPIPIGSSGIVTGWGYMGNTASLADRLQWAHASIITNEKCKRVYPTLSNKEVCTTNSNFESICPGDSGGPLVMESTGELIGIIDSTNDITCEHGYPVIYTRVSPYLEWIRQKTGIWY